MNMNGIRAMGALLTKQKMSIKSNSGGLATLVEGDSGGSTGDDILLVSHDMTKPIRESRYQVTSTVHSGGWW